MAQGSFVQVSPASTGVKLATGATYTENANTVQDPKVIQGEAYLPVYTFVASAVALSTSTSHLLEIMAGAALNVRIRRITVTQNTASGAVNAVAYLLFRLTTAGTGGTAVTARPFDTSDAAAGATGMTLPSSKGTEGVQLWQESAWVGTAAIPIAASALRWVEVDMDKPIIIPAGTSNGLAIKMVGGSAAGTVDISVEFSETSF